MLHLEWLTEYAAKTGCQVHAYVLMANRVHLLLSAGNAETVGALMKALGQRYVQYVNRAYRRSGTLWERRFRSCLTQDESTACVFMPFLQEKRFMFGHCNFHTAYFDWPHPINTRQADRGKPEFAFTRQGLRVREHPEIPPAPL